MTNEFGELERTEGCEAMRKDEFGNDCGGKYGGLPPVLIAKPGCVYGLGKSFKPRKLKEGHACTPPTFASAIRA